MVAVPPQMVATMIEKQEPDIATGLNLNPLNMSLDHHSKALHLSITRIIFGGDSPVTVDTWIAMGMG